MSDLKVLIDELDKAQNSSFNLPGNYCELLDENEPDGWVAFRRASGAEYMRMPREDYDAFRKYKE